MSSRAQAWCWENSKAKGSVLLVLLRIADQAGHHGENSWPGIPRIADDCNLSTRQVQKCISQLVDLGELLVFQNAGGSKDCPADRRPNRYELPKMADWTPPRHIKPSSDPFNYMNPVFELDPAEDNGVNSTTPREVSPTTPRDDDGVNYRTQRGELQGSNGVNCATPDMPLDPSVRKSSSAREGRDYSDWRPAAAVLDRIKMMRPGITDEFLEETLLEFITFAEKHYRLDQLDSKFLANANRAWFRSQNRNAKGPPKDADGLVEWATANQAPAANEGESPYSYRQRLYEWIDAGRPAVPVSDEATVSAAIQDAFESDPYAELKTAGAAK